MYNLIYSHSPGAIIVSLCYNGHDELDLRRRALVFGILAACSAFGTIAVFLTRAQVVREREEVPSERAEIIVQEEQRLAINPTGPADSTANAPASTSCDCDPAKESNAGMLGSEYCTNTSSLFC